MLTTVKVYAKERKQIEEFCNLLEQESESGRYLCSEELDWEFKSQSVKEEGLTELVIEGAKLDNYTLSDLFLSSDENSTLMTLRECAHDDDIMSFEEVSMELGLEIHAKNTYLEGGNEYLHEYLVVKDGEVKFYEETPLYFKIQLEDGEFKEVSINDYMSFE